MAHYSLDSAKYGHVEFDHENPNMDSTQVAALLDQHMASPESLPTGFDVPKPIQLGAKLLNMAERTKSSAGAGIEQLLSGKGNAGAVASFMKGMAGSPAAPGERMGSFIGGLGSPMNLAAQALPGGTLAKAMGGGALISGGSDLLNQAEQGNIDPSKSIIPTALGAGLGGVVHGIASTPKAFLKEIPGIMEEGTGVPKAATDIFMQNPGIEKGGPATSEGVIQNTKDAVGGVRGALADLMSSSKKNWNNAADQSNIQMTAAERAYSGKWTPEQISDAVEGKPTKVPGVREPGLTTLVNVLSQGDPSKPGIKKSQTDLLKTLYLVRGKISDHFKSFPLGIGETASTQQSALGEYRTQINNLIEKLPGSDVLRSADAVRAGAKDIAAKLGSKLDRPGDALDFLKKTFAMADSNSEEDMTNLRALEKASGKPIIDDLFKALTKAHFSPALAGNMVKRSFLGISPFLASAGLRVAGLPFQFSLPVAAALTTAGRSAPFMGKLIRGAQAAEPYAMPAARATAVAGIAALRKMQEAK